MFLHSFATEEICSASLVVENVQLLSDLLAKFFASGGEVREWKTGFTLKFEHAKTGGHRSGVDQNYRIL
jgi:hypothetical protein